MFAKRFDVFLVALDPAQGAEIQKKRPCLVISPGEMNQFISTVIVAPMTTKGRSYPTRIPCKFQNRRSHIVLDQIRTVDKSRLLEKLGRIGTRIQDRVILALIEMLSR